MENSYRKNQLKKTEEAGGGSRGQLEAATDVFRLSWKMGGREDIKRTRIGD